MAGDYPVEAHEFQINNMQERLATLEEQMEDMIAFRARSEAEVKTVFKILEEVKSMLKEYTVEMKKAIADLGLQLNTRIGDVEKDMKAMTKKDGDRAIDRWEAMLREGLKYGLLLLLGYLLSKGGLK